MEEQNNGHAAPVCAAANSGAVVPRRRIPCDLPAFPVDLPRFRSSSVGDPLLLTGLFRVTYRVRQRNRLRTRIETRPLYETPEESGSRGRQTESHQAGSDAVDSLTAGARSLQLQTPPHLPAPRAGSQGHGRPGPSVAPAARASSAATPDCGSRAEGRGPRWSRRSARRRRRPRSRVVSMRAPRRGRAARP